MPLPPSARDLVLVLVLCGAASAQVCSKDWLPAAGLSGGEVWSTVVFDDGSGPALFAAGDFDTAAGSHVSKWSGSSWTPLGLGLQDGNFTELPFTFGDDMIAFDDGSGPALYVCGDFTKAGGVPANNIARWNGSGWSALGDGLNDATFVLGVFDDGHGPALYAGGNFGKADGGLASGVARWKNSHWTPLGAGVSGGLGEPEAFAVFDDGNGPALYVGGGFSTAGGGTVNHLARWNGLAWSSVGGGTDGIVDGLAVFNDGSGPALYVAGSFTHAGNVAASHIARWNGSTWSAVGSGFDGQAIALTAFDDGGGPGLYAGGNFTYAGSLQTNRIAKWDGAAWSWLGAGIGSGFDGSVQRITPFDDGSGTALFVAGEFGSAGGAPASNLAKWGCSSTPSAWTFLGSGLTGTSGIPSLVGAGTLQPASAGSLTLSKARKTAPALLLMSLASTPLPFKGGTLVAVPTALVLHMKTTSLGGASLPFTWPSGVPSGLLLWFQFAISDPFGVHDVALSNAVLATVP